MIDRRTQTHSTPLEVASTLGFLAAVLLSSIQAVEDARWIDRPPPLLAIGSIALLLGLLFSRLRTIPPTILHLTAASVGLVVTAWAVTAPLMTGTTADRVLDLLGRLDAWALTLRTGGIASDPLPFAVLLAVLSWSLAYAGAWSCFRYRQPWWAIIPSGAVLLTSLAYGPPILNRWLVVYLVAAMLLIARLHLSVLESRWRREHMDRPRRLGWRWYRETLICGAIAATLAWNLPPVPVIPAVQQAWSHAFDRPSPMAPNLNRLFAGLQRQDQGAATFFGDTLALRGAFTLSDAPVMIVHAAEPHYWRATVYDTYTGRGWTRRLAERLTVAAGESFVDRLGIGSLGARQMITQTVAFAAEKGDVLFVAGQPLAISVPAEALIVRAPDGQADLLQIRSLTPLDAGKGFSALSVVSAARVDNLRRSDQVPYPDWIKDVYLPLPAALPDRVRQLARQITTGAPTNYDRAVAIESYLRTLRYTTNLTPPPVDRDGVDYFLFTAREGYCDYFASAMAVMLRSIGIPARVVSGYQPGDRIPGTDEWLVRERHAHSWVEAYFPGQGWIEFEPTPSQPPRDRPDQLLGGPTPTSPPPVGSLDQPTRTMPQPATRPPQALDNHPVGQAERAQRPSRPFHVPGWLLIVLTAPFGLGGTVLALWRLGQRGLDPVTAAYWRLSILARLAGLPHRASATPIEYASLIDAALGSEGARTIAAAYTARRYGGVAATVPDVIAIERAWAEVRYRLIQFIMGKGRRTRTPSESSITDVGGGSSG